MGDHPDNPSKPPQSKSIRIVNLIFASGALLIHALVFAGVSRRGSPSPRLHVFTVQELISDLVVLFWFMGAIGLFFRNRFAWIGSLLGVGASVCFLAVAFVTIIGLYLFPNEEMHHLKDIGGSGYIAALIIAVVEFSVLLALFSALFIGLLKMRKDLR